MIKNNRFIIFLLVLITVSGLFLRLYGLYKPSGLWFDEMASFYVANHSFPFGILNVLYNEEGHAPLYFMFLHFWMNFFGNSDISLRLLSVFFGVLNIPVIYLAGKELDSRKTGLIAAAFLSINSLLIYYSQEVRFYSLLGLLSTLSILFLLKINNNPCRKNYVGFILSNIAILYTYTIGFLFIFLEAVLFIIFSYRNRESLKKFLIAQSVTFALFIPYLPIFLHHTYTFSHCFLNPFHWARFNSSSILIVISDWFSPIIYGINDKIIEIYKKALSNQDLLKGLVLFNVMPVIIYILAILKGLTSKVEAKIVFFSGFLFLFVEVFMAINQKFILEPRYTLLCLPLIILVASFGISRLKSQILSGFLIIILLFINIFYIVKATNSAPKSLRPSGYKVVANILKKLPLNENDILIFPVGGKYFFKYYPKDKIALSSFDFDRSFYYYAYNPEFLERILDKKIVKTINRKNSYDILKTYLASPDISRPFENYLNNEIVKKAKKGRFVVIVIPTTFHQYDSNNLKQITKNQTKYKNRSLYFLLTSKLFNDILGFCSSNYEHVITINSTTWNIAVFEKQ